MSRHHLGREWFHDVPHLATIVVATANSHSRCSGSVTRAGCATAVCIVNGITAQHSTMKLWNDDFDIVVLVSQARMRIALQ
jgi:hypothetical protein